MICMESLDLSYKLIALNWLKIESKTLSRPNLVYVSSILGT